MRLSDGHLPQDTAERQHVLLLDADRVTFHCLPLVLPALQIGIFQLTRLTELAGEVGTVAGGQQRFIQLWQQQGGGDGQAGRIIVGKDNYPRGGRQPLQQLAGTPGQAAMTAVDDQAAGQFGRCRIVLPVVETVEVSDQHHVGDGGAVQAFQRHAQAEAGGKGRERCRQGALDQHEVVVGATAGDLLVDGTGGDFAATAVRHALQRVEAPFIPRHALQQPARFGVEVQPSARGAAQLEVGVELLPGAVELHPVQTLAQQPVHGVVVAAGQASHSEISRTMKLPLNTGCASPSGSSWKQARCSSGSAS